jgi:hypothetical protein
MRLYENPSKSDEIMSGFIPLISTRSKELHPPSFPTANTPKGSPRSIVHLGPKKKTAHGFP